MGTQQILMIILSVIVVGTAIAVGIQMFDTYYDNARRQQGTIELHRICGMVEAWYRTPVAMGGGGNGLNPDGSERVPTAIEIGRYVNRSAAAVGGDIRWTTAQGIFEITPFELTTGNLNNTARLRIRIYYDVAGLAPHTTKMYYFDGRATNAEHFF